MNADANYTALQQRLAEVETRLTFIDDAVAGLATADIDRSRQMQVIERTLADMRSELQSMRVDIGHGAQDEPPPPHY